MAKLLSLLLIWNLELGIWNSSAHSDFRIPDSEFLPLPAAAQVTGSARTALAIVEDIRTRRALVDLGADDFVVQEAADVREVLSVRPADYPVVLMIDDGGAADDLPELLKAARRFVERLGRERPVAVGTFDGRARMLAGFDADRSALMTQLDEVGPAARAVSAEGEALELAAGTLAATASPFSAIVILSATPGDGRESAGSNTETQDSTASVIERGAILHVIARRSNMPSPGANRPPASNRDEGLRALAEQSRGQFVTIYTAASFEAAIDRLAARMTSELMIEYLVPNQSKATDVKLGVRVPGARVRGLGVR